ncbi:PadR family transcriptional regulator [Rhizomonospora bruguierae]|uniref:PadR family transcriptional regulator n=1 Tax=Rhizomonospora bruguierae TaxID=1581705 RepID=UPI001BD1B9EE|nr:PadR family transcriptional regulator [Micromonospora sp. NBRC 107566]
MRSTRRGALTPLALTVLRLLTQGGPMHPYEMHQRIREQHTDHVIKLRAGSLYHTVERLHRADLVEPVETGREGRRPERTVYAITEAGAEEFSAGLHDLLRAPRDEYPVFAAAVEMLHALPPADAARLLGERLIALEGHLARVERIRVGLLRDRDLDRVLLVELEYKEAMCRAEVAWVRGLLDEIASGRLSWPAPEENR